MDISKYRLRLRNLFEEQMKLLNIFLGIRELIKGGIYMTRTKCGKKGCKCESGKELHSVWRFYRSKEGKTEIKTIDEEKMFKYENYTKNYQRYRQARAQLVKLQRQQIKIIDLIEKGIRKEKIVHQLFKIRG